MNKADLVDTPACKFCGIPEGAPDRRGAVAHINNQQLCASCYYVLQRAKYEPDKVSDEDKAWFDEMCRFNFNHGMFVPVAQRRVLKAVWRCKRCGNTRLVCRDENYTNYCMSCASAARTGRVMPTGPARKERCDKGLSHASVPGRGQGVHKVW